MLALEAVHTYEGRLASFAVAHHQPKRRPSAASTKGTKGSKWPHTTPSPDQLAKAGFYYKPVASTDDNVTCFLCNRSLDGWEEDDDPIAEHLHHSSNCGWAINMTIERRNGTEDRKEDDPTSNTMMQARKATFSDLWPYEHRKGWIPKIEKMAEAGWIFTPTPESDDYVTCPYCCLSLDGWEPKDNPRDEHQRRSPDCLFFVLAKQATSSSKPAKTKRGRLSKARSSAVSSFSIAPESSILDGTNLGNDSALSVLTTSTESAMTQKKAKGKKTKGAGPSKQATTNDISNMEAQPATAVVEPEDADFEVKVPPTKQTKAKKSKKRKSDEADSVHESVQENPVVPPPAKKRAMRSRTLSAQIQSPELPIQQAVRDEDISMVDSEPPKAIVVPKRGSRAARSSTAKPVARNVSATSTASKASLRMEEPDDDEVDKSLEVDLARPLTDDEDTAMEEEPKAAGRRLTKTRPGAKKATASVAYTRKAARDVEVFDAPAADREALRAADPKPSRGKKTAKGGRKAASKAVALGEGEEVNNSAAIESSLVSIPLQELSVHSSPAATARPAPPSKRAATRQTSRRMPARSTRGSVLPIAESANPPASDIDMSILSTNDDSDHETDMSMASQATTRRRGAKGLNHAAKKEKGSEPAIVGKTIEDVMQKTTGSLLAQEQAAPAKEKPKRGRTTRKQAVEIHEAVAQAEPRPADKMDVDEPEAVNEPEVQKPAKEKTARAKGKGKGATKPDTKQAVAAAVREEPAPPQRSSATASYQQSAQPEQAPATIVYEDPPHPKTLVATPSPSPQSSDAENQPPSSRPNQAPQLQALAVIPQAKNTPRASPSKRNPVVGNQLQSTNPWLSADLEAVFQPSSDKENPPLHKPAGAVPELSSPEKRMNVEEWVRWNATQQETQLKQECERLVGIFEREGNRAIGALEGVHVLSPL